LTEEEEKEKKAVSKGWETCSFCGKSIKREDFDKHLERMHLNKSADTSEAEVNEGNKDRKPISVEKSPLPQGPIIKIDLILILTAGLLIVAGAHSCSLLGVIGYLIGFAGFASAFPHLKKSSIEVEIGALLFVFFLIIGIIQMISSANNDKTSRYADSVNQLAIASTILGTALFLFFAQKESQVKRPFEISVFCFLGIVFLTYVLFVDVSYGTLIAIAEERSWDDSFRSSFVIRESTSILAGLFGLIAFKFLLEMKIVGYRMILIIGAVSLFVILFFSFNIDEIHFLGWFVLIIFFLTQGKHFKN
jgi:hypothetical protein